MFWKYVIVIFSLYENVYKCFYFRKNLLVGKSYLELIFKYGIGEDDYVKLLFVLIRSL